MSPSEGFRKFCQKCKHHESQNNAGECWHICSFQTSGKVIWKDADPNFRELGEKTAEVINKAVIENPLLAYRRCPYQLEYTMSAQE